LSRSFLSLSAFRTKHEVRAAVAQKKLDEAKQAYNDQLVLVNQLDSIQNAKKIDDNSANQYRLEQGIIFTSCSFDLPQFFVLNSLLRLLLCLGEKLG
jgi:hypothetical protein